MRMSTAAVSKNVAALEARIKARLFDRTTRRVGVTEAGRVYFFERSDLFRHLELDRVACPRRLASSRHACSAPRVASPASFAGRA
ncbi:MAG TPA: LysR family transcriptional regulator [Woeseiaceae bacterium]